MFIQVKDNERNVGISDIDSHLCPHLQFRSVSVPSTEGSLQFVGDYGLWLC